DSGTSQRTCEAPQFPPARIRQRMTRISSRARPACRGWLVTQQHFPSTRLTAIQGWVRQNDYTSLNHHLMSAYYEPIRRYVKGSRWVASHMATRGDPAGESARPATTGDGEEELNELVNGFFAHLLDKRDFIDGWLGSGRRLGQYLRGAVWLYLTGLRRDA